MSQIYVEGGYRFNTFTHTLYNSQLYFSLNFITPKQQKSKNVCLRAMAITNLMVDDYFLDKLAGGGEEVL